MKINSSFSQKVMLPRLKRGFMKNDDTTVDQALSTKQHSEKQLESSRSFQAPELISLGDARTLIQGMPNGRWQDGSFNPTRYKN